MVGSAANFPLPVIKWSELTLNPKKPDRPFSCFLSVDSPSLSESSVVFRSVLPSRLNRLTEG